jgi:hypothetical protein
MRTMRTAIVLAALLAPSMSMALAQEKAEQKAEPTLQEQMQMGTPEERAHCRPDVRKHCSKIDLSKGETHLGCLKSNREKLAKACQDVLSKYGQ